MRLVVGLGNPGRAYAASRHNVGYQCLAFLVRRWSIPLEQRHRLARWGEGMVEGQQLYLGRSRTFMNESGQGVAYLLRRLSLTPAELLLIYDDLDLPLGTVRLRPRGGPGGHRGVLSVTEALGTQDFPRVRIGIGRPPPGQDEVAYVLSPFLREEQAAVQEALERAADAVACALAEGMEAAMNRFNA